uniref:Uncharacterized protein n=1 Tax=Pyxicephalus adspersus TaxID=30357 RepID=A0AAV3AK45_PYXAD|nr:TPA: hypothetical protein GDO54_012410 [Pyxicephalus adspersus]
MVREIDIYVQLTIIRFGVSWLMITHQIHSKLTFLCRAVSSTFVASFHGETALKSVASSSKIMERKCYLKIIDRRITITVQTKLDQTHKK